MSFLKNIMKRRAGSVKNPVKEQWRTRLGVENLEDRLVPALVLPGKMTPIFEIYHPTGGMQQATSNTVPTGAYTPLQLRTAYGVNSSNLTGAGQTIAILDAYNDSTVLADLDVFDKQFAATSSGTSLYAQYGAAASFLTVYNENGQVINPSNTTVPVDSTGGWEGEEALDVEWAHAMAPGARIALVECSSANYTDLFAGVKSAAALSGVSVVSMSWGGSEFNGETSYDSYFTTPAGHNGVTFLASTGDQSYGGYPAFSPNVIAVGGTTLTLNSANAIQSETAWSTGSDSWALSNGTGGGTSVYETMPSYQSGFQTTGKRTTPDVSFEADPATGVAMYCSFSTSSSSALGWITIGGTSLSSPAWAGVMAMANQARVAAGQTTLNTTSPTQALTSLYSLPSGDFHDITTGSITANGQTYKAGVGYDEVTGRGSPVVNQLVSGLAGTGTVVAPAVPSFTVTAVSGTQINLTWGAVTGASSYLVYEWTGTNTLIATLDSSTTSYTVTGLSPGTTYYFDLAASNSAGTTWAMNYQGATTLKAGPPAVPSFSLSAVSGTQINLTWGTVTGASSYLVYEWTGANTLIATLGSGTTSYTVTGLSPGTTYYFDLAASNSAGTTWAMNYQGATTLKAGPPAAPSFSLSAVSGTQINLTWGAVTGASNYLVYEWTGANTLIATLDSSTTSYAVTGLSPGTTYYFDLAASNSAGTTWAINYQGATTLKAGPPAVPSFSLSAVSGTQINLTWGTAAGASSYLVYEWTGANTLIATLDSNTTSYAVTGLSPGTTYYFDLAASNSAGTTWAKNYQGAITLIGPPAAPSFSLSAVSTTQIGLTWGTVANASGYLVDIWTSSGWTQIGNFGSGTTSCTVNNLSPGTTYYFEMAAYNSAGTTWTSYQGATTLNPSPPAAPWFYGIAVSRTQVNLTWGTVANASGYLVDIWTSSGWTQIGNFGSGTTGCTVSGLNPSTTYYFDVATYNSAGTTWANYQGVLTFNSVINPNLAGATGYSSAFQGPAVTQSYSGMQPQIKGPTKVDSSNLLDSSSQEIADLRASDSSQWTPRLVLGLDEVLQGSKTRDELA